jgi:16S rRNA (cytidine1402-2'-O)-methyltransferase
MLYLVATPIGHLDDISQRALDTLRSVDLIASEDTRKTGRLLKHYGISQSQISFHAFNEDQAGERVMGLLREGRSVAVVTDAGTPGIARSRLFPGAPRHRRGAARHHDPRSRPSSWPGCCRGCLFQLFLSGVSSPQVRRQAALSGRRCRRAPYPSSITSCPHRLIATQRDALATFGDRRAALANDLTKLYENVRRGTLSELIEELAEARLQGEFVLVIAAGRRRQRRRSATRGLPTMNEPEELAPLVAEVQAAAKYRQITPDLIRRLGARELAHRRNYKEAVQGHQEQAPSGGRRLISPTRLTYERWLAQLSRARPSRRRRCARPAARFMAGHASHSRAAAAAGHPLRRALAALAPVHSVIDVACGFHHPWRFPGCLWHRAPRIRPWISIST